MDSLEYHLKHDVECIVLHSVFIIALQCRYMCSATTVASRKVYRQVFVKAVASFPDRQFPAYTLYAANRDFWICTRSIRPGQHQHGNGIYLGRRIAVSNSCVHIGMRT